jgi:hypothetical protein
LDEETLANIMKACIIMHNMIIKDEGEQWTLDLTMNMKSILLYQCHMVKYHNYMIFFKLIIESRIEQLALNYKKIWLNICGNNIATSIIIRFELLMPS